MSTAYGPQEATTEDVRCAGQALSAQPESAELGSAWAAAYDSRSAASWRAQARAEAAEADQEAEAGPDPDGMTYEQWMDEAHHQPQADLIGQPDAPEAGS